jgi:GWxTD domain-containing protein
MRRTAQKLVLCLFAAALLPGAEAKKKQQGDDDPPPLKQWISGPVRYIATRDEVRQFRALSSDNDRALFVERFWTRRDPTPQTLSNEYRQMFWERVQEANKGFHGSTKPGWLTDRGKIHILYGPPTEIEEAREVQAGDTTGRGVIRWIYEDRPGGRRDLDAITVVAFYRDTSGEYRVSRDPVLNSVFFDAYALTDRPFGQWTDVWLAPTRSELSVMLDLGKLQEVPPQEQVLLERVSTIESYRTTSLDVHIGRYEHPDKPGGLVALTVDAARTAGQPAVLARFTPRDATKRPRLISEGSFRLEQFGERRVIQGKVVLEPGTYDLMVLSADPFDATTGMHRGVVVVPPTGDRLRVSDVTLAAVLEPLEYRSLVSHDEPFLLGPYRTVPRFEATIRRGENVDVMFEVYGGSPPYSTVYRLQGHEDDESWTTLGQPQEYATEQSAQAWGVPTGAAWPLGEYRVLIEVRDAAGSSVTALAPFRLLGDGETGE